MQRPAADDPPTPPPPFIPYFHERMKVLLVGIDDATQRSILNQLSHLYYERIVIPDNAPLALRFIENNPVVDLVLSDISLKGPINGYQFIAQVQLLRRNIPHVVILGRERSGQETRNVYAWGASYVLWKPVSEQSAEIQNLWQHAFRAKIKPRPSSSPLPSSVPQQASVQRRNEIMNEGQQPTPKKTRLLWSGHLHQGFLNAVHELGPNAVPKRILEHMKVHMGTAAADLTRENVGSHLQKYRENQKKANGMTVVTVNGFPPHRHIINNNNALPTASHVLQSLHQKHCMTDHPLMRFMNMPPHEQPVPYGNMHQPTRRPVLSCVSCVNHGAHPSSGSGISIGRTHMEHQPVTQNLTLDTQPLSTSNMVQQTITQIDQNPSSGVTSFRRSNMEQQPITNFGAQQLDQNPSSGNQDQSLGTSFQRRNMEQCAQQLDQNPSNLTSGMQQLDQNPSGNQNQSLATSFKRSDMEHHLITQNPSSGVTSFNMEQQPRTQQLDQNPIPSSGNQDQFQRRNMEQCAQQLDQNPSNLASGMQQLNQNPSGNQNQSLATSFTRSDMEHHLITQNPSSGVTSFRRSNMEQQPITTSGMDQNPNPSSGNQDQSLGTSFQRRNMDQNQSLANSFERSNMEQQLITQNLTSSTQQLDHSIERSERNNMEQQPIANMEQQPTQQLDQNISNNPIRSGHDGMITLEPANQDDEGWNCFDDSNFKFPEEDEGGNFLFPQLDSDYLDELLNKDDQSYN